MTPENEVQAPKPAQSSLSMNELSSSFVSNPAITTHQDLILGLQTAIDQTGSYIFTKDMLGRYTYVNIKVQELFNATFNDIVGKDDTQFFDLEIANDIRLNDRRVLDLGVTIEQEEVIVIKQTGEKRIFWAVKKPVKNANGQIIGICGVSTDITEIKRTENLLRESSSELMESQLIAGLGTYVLDVVSGVWKSSPVLDQIFGIDEHYQRTVTGWESIIHSDDRVVMHDYLLYEVVGNREKFDKEYRIVRNNDNAVRWLHGLGKLDFDMKGQPIKMHGTIQDITDRKLVENALRQSEAFLRLSQTVGGIGSWEADLVNNKQIWSKGCITLLGLPALESPTWNDFLNLVHPDDRQRVIDATQAHLDHGSKYDVEFRAITNDGEIRWIRSTGLAERGVNGIPILMRGIAQDITQQHNIDEALRRNEELYLKMFQTSLDIINISRLSDGVYVEVNEAFLNTLGYRREEVIGRTALDINVWADLEVRKLFLEKLNKDSEFRDLEARFISKSGKVIWGLMSSAIINIEGAPCLLAITRNITNRKIAEENLRITASVFGLSQEAIIITDAENNIVDVNAAFTRITGYSREEVIGKNPALLSSGQNDQKLYKQLWESLQEKGSWRGEIWNRRKSGEIYPEMLSISTLSDNNENVIRHVAVFSDISILKEHEAELVRVAHFDALTSIPNRILLADRMKQAIFQTSREQNMMAVCYLDLDGFKPINDSLGHQVGDEVLVEIAKRISETIRGGDTVARLGGDEFVVLLLGLSKGEECVVTLERLLLAIAAPIMVNKKTVNVSASIGVSIYPLDEEDPDTLLRHADQAMYVAKQTGKNRFHIYDVALDKRARDQNEFLKSIHRALELNQFELHYQPKVNLQTKKLVGAEALIRWRHHERGLLAPAEFLRHIDNTELDILIGEWVTATALAQMHHWRSIGLDLEVSINISGYHLESAGFVDMLQQQLANYPDLPTGRLQIEILETVAINDITVVQEIIESCRKIGIGFALDDFGTGYSSLSYLSTLPVDTLKIDQSFVRDMLEDKGDRAIVHGIIVLAKAFERETVAEGIESDEHYRALLNLGCDIGQGYGIARPMSALDLAGWQGRYRYVVR